MESSTPKTDNGAEATPKARPSATPFGTKARGFMTPRHTKGSPSLDFRQQLLDNAASKQQKKFRSSAAPKGSKLAAGYTDRTQERYDEEQDDKAKRVKALEESMKLGQIDQATFENLRDQITGGDLRSTHLVKGLDRRLLERIKRGEDVNAPVREEVVEEPVDVDDELDKLEEEEVSGVVREKVVKKGSMAPPPPVAGVKRDRNAILAELKAQRQAAAEAKAAANSRFHKIGEKKDSSRIEIDEKGREVLIVTDADGNVKRKVRKAKVEDEAGVTPKTAEVLGAEVIIPKQPTPPPAEEEEDMFADAGTDYDPFANLAKDDDSSSSEDEDEGEVKEARDKAPSPKARRSPEPKPEETPSTEASSAPQRRNYFDDDPAEDDKSQHNPLRDPTLLAALRKSRDVERKPSVDPEEAAREKRRAAMLASSNRDFEDMDMGFGSSRFEDEREAEEGDVKLSNWGNGDEEGEEGRGGKKRKRGPKRKKGDKNSAVDVLRVMEGRKGKS